VAHLMLHGRFHTEQVLGCGAAREMTYLRDRCLLVGSALGVGIVLLTGALALAVAGVDEAWTELWLVTVFLFLSAITVWAGTVRSTPVWRLPRKPFFLTWLGLLLTHLLVLGSVLHGFHPHWRMGEWMLVLWAEWIIFAAVLGRVGTLTRVRHRVTKQHMNESGHDVRGRTGACP
jgi:hypothetical protein